MLHIPKELVLGRSFPGLESSSSRSSDSGSDSDGEAPPPVVVNMARERQRVLIPSRHRLRPRPRYDYTRVPPNEGLYTFGCGPSFRHSMTCTRNQHRKSVHRMYESCPALFDVYKYVNDPQDYDRLVRNREPINGHVSNGMGLQPGRRDGADDDDDSDMDIPFNKVLRWLRMPRDRQRSSSESDLLRCSMSDSLDFGYINPRFPHRLSATEIQLHATEDCDVIVQVTNRTPLSNQAEVG